MQSVTHSILKQLIRKKFKDKELLWLLDNIIESTDGLPIGNYTSQWLSNLYLNYFDHFVKEELKVKDYFRYCDDIVILGHSKKELHNIRFRIQCYLYYNLKLELSGYRVFPVSEGIDFLGYKTFKNFILLRKSIKKRFIRMIKYSRNWKSIASYNGWLSWCNSRNLIKKYING